MMDADFIFRTDANSSSSSSPFVSFVSLWSISPGLRVSVVFFPFFPRLPLWYNETIAAPGAHYERPGLVGPARNTVGPLGLAGRSLSRMRDQG